MPSINLIGVDALFDSYTMMKRERERERENARGCGVWGGRRVSSKGTKAKRGGFSIYP
jgi:hypothetical protein